MYGKSCGVKPLRLSLQVKTMKLHFNPELKAGITQGSRGRIHAPFFGTPSQIRGDAAEFSSDFQTYPPLNNPTKHVGSSIHLSSKKQISHDGCRTVFGVTFPKDEKLSWKRNDNVSTKSIPRLCKTKRKISEVLFLTSVQCDIL